MLILFLLFNGANMVYQDIRSMNNSYIRDKIINCIIRDCLFYSQDKPFKLSSGKYSPLYIDLSYLTCNGKYSLLLAKLIADEVRDLNFTHIVCPALGGVPVGISLINYYSLFNLHLSCLVYRSETKDHGLEQKIEGLYTPYINVIVVDDVLTTGSTLVKVNELCQELEFNVLTNVVIIDRSDDKIDLNYRSIFKLSDILEKLNLSVI